METKLSTRPAFSLEHIATLLMVRPARTVEGKRVQALVLARVEAAMASK